MAADREHDTGADWDVIVVGAGFAGLYALHRLRQRGFRVAVFEAGSSVGGTWYWNRYPGARCDVQSLVYCYMFDEELHRSWRWTERFATQPEILSYLEHVTDRLDLRRDITFDCRIESAVFDEDAHRWTLITEQGDEVAARHVIMATGGLSAGRLPGVPGLEDFRGEYYHTGSWPVDGVDLAGKRVGIIGTGSSGVQAIPLVAEVAAHLTVFQRTAGFIAPARNQPITDEEYAKLYARFDDVYRGLHAGTVVGGGDIVISDHLPPKKPLTFEVPPEERRELLEGRWKIGSIAVAGTFGDTMKDAEANEVVADFFREKIREIVHDPEVAEILTPRGYPVGSRRICVGTNYYETFNRDNVTLVDISDTPIESFTERGLRTAAADYEFDVLILATGFDALTGALTRIDIRGRDGESLREYWERSGPQAYLGVSVAGFPNLYTVNGPGSPGILANVVIGIEQHLDWIIGLLEHLRTRGADLVESDAQAQADWFRHVNEAAYETLYVRGKNWWMKEVPGGGPKVFVPYIRGLAVYGEIIDEIAADGYRGFHISAEPTPVLG